MHKVTNNKILKNVAQEHYSEEGACIGNSHKKYVCHTISYPDFYHIHPFF